MPRLIIGISLLALVLHAQSSVIERLEAAPTDDARAALFASERAGVDSAVLLKDLRARGQKAFEAYDYTKALASFQAALVVSRALQSDTEIAVSLERVARTVFRMNRFEEALGLFQQALDASRAANDQAGQIKCLRGLGNTLAAMGRNREALGAEEQCMRLAESLDDQRNVSFSLLNLAQEHSLLGDNRAALDHYRRALDLGEKLQLQETVQSALSGLARVYTGQGDFDLALSYLNRLKPVRGTSLGDQRYEAYRLSQYATIYDRTGRNQELLQAATRGMEMAHQTGDLRLESWFLQVRAEARTRLHQARETIPDFETAAAIFDRLGSLDQEAATRARLAAQYLAANEIEKAEAAAEHACQLAQKIDTVHVQAEALVARGRVYRAEHRRKDAEADFGQAIALLDLARRQMIGGTVEGPRIYQEQSDAYRELMELKMEEGDLTGAVDASELARARHLLDVISQSKTDISHSLSLEEQQREQQLQREEARWNAALSKAGAAQQTKAAFQKAAGDLEVFRAGLYLKHPDLQMRRGENKPLSLETAGGLLPDSHTALIEYIVSDNLDTTLLAIVRGPSGQPLVKASQLPFRRSEWEKRVEQFRSSLATRDLTYRDLARALYRDLLAPVQPLLSSINTVAILPDGPLWNLPFQALIGADGKYLIEHAAVFYAPSLTTLEVTHERARSSYVPGRTLFAMASSAEEHEEVEKLAGIYGKASSSVLVGNAATKVSWQAQAPRYRVLHLAAHGILNGADPLYSALQLDGMLEAREILDEDLHAELAVLSACETARGKVVEGEGVLGLSWAVLMAGVPSVVVSQWKVDASGTAELMLAFHRSLARQLSRGGTLQKKAEALRQAFLEVLRSPQFHHPFYWAGFEMLGDGY